MERLRNLEGHLRYIITLSRSLRSRTGEPSNPKELRTPPTNVTRGNAKVADASTISACNGAGLQLMEI